MSDAEGSSRKGQYKIEYSPNNRAACKGPKPCKGTKLSTGEMRLGTVNEVKGHISWAYRHYGCTTSTVFNNMKKAYGAASEVEGFDQLKPEDQEKFTKAWDKGEVEPEDVPASAKAAEGEEAPKKKPSRPRKKQKTSDYGDDDDDEEDEPKPKKKAAPRRKKKKADSDDDEDDEDDEDYNVGQKRKRGGKKGSKKKGADDDDY